MQSYGGLTLRMVVRQYSDVYVMGIRLMVHDNGRMRSYLCGVGSLNKVLPLDLDEVARVRGCLGLGGCRRRRVYILVAARTTSAAAGRGFTFCVLSWKWGRKDGSEEGK